MIVKIVVFLFCLSLASGRVPFFRRDYTYVEQFNSFYKLHLTSGGNSWISSFQACDDEGSVLFYPKTNDEWTVAKTLATLKPNVSAILVGIHDDTGMGEFITIEGLPTPLPLMDEYQPASNGADTCVMMDVESGAYYLEACQTDAPRPFVCKRIELPSCPTIDHGQKFDSGFYRLWWNNREENTKKDCGVALQSSYESLYTITRDCQDPAPFVCEMKAV